jgi:hypothetical protein
MPDDVRVKVIERLESIPKHHEDMCREHLPGVINFIKNGSYNKALWDEFKKRIIDHDDYRKQSFSAAYPEYARIVGL